VGKVGYVGGGMV